MKFEEIVALGQKMPVLESHFFSAGQAGLASVEVQLSRWVNAGKLIRLKRGVYLLNTPYRKLDINEYHLAAVLKKPSYVSLEKAMEYHNLIPEAVYVYTCLTTKRPGRFQTQCGDYEYRHIKKELFFGYEALSWDGQTIYMARPEKALLDLFYMNHIKVTGDYLNGLRLQHQEALDPQLLMEYARNFKSPRIHRAAGVLAGYMAASPREKAL